VTSHARERVNLAALRVVMGILGAALGLVVGSLVIAEFGFLAMGMLLGFVGLATRYAAVAGVWRWANREARVAGMSVRQGFALIARNQPFRYYLPSFILFSMGLSILTQLIPFHVSAVLQEGEQIVSLVTGVFLLGVVFSVPLVTRLAARWGKRAVYGRAMLLTGLLLPALAVAGFLPGPPPLLQLVLLVAVLGVAMSSAFVFPAALMADIIDHDEDRSGSRREASYFGTEQGLQKIGIGLSSVVLTQVLETFGYSPENPLGIQMVGPIAAFLVLLGALIFIGGYRLDPKPHPIAARAQSTFL
jgi:GPH family glycoside/pentoside/hexuronide:cation symporter